MSEILERLDPRSSPSLRVGLLGPFEIRRSCDGELIELPRKVRALFAYLVTRRGVSVPRQTLLGLLWGDRSEEQARSSLRQALNILRAALEDTAAAVLNSTSESVSVKTDTVVTDLDAFLGDCGAKISEAETSSIEPDSFEFLEGLAIDEAGFQDWLLEEREKVRTRLVEQLSMISDAQEAAGHIESAASYTASRLRLAPLDEAAHRQMMRLHLARKRSDAAIGQFEKCKSVLREQLNVAPAPETVALWEEAKRVRRNSVQTPLTEADKGPAAATPYLAASRCPEEFRSAVERAMIERGGRLKAEAYANASIIAVFQDASEALRACVDARTRLRDLGSGELPGASFALHAAEYSEPGEPFVQKDFARLDAVLNTTVAGEIHATERFFQAVRRNSPCFFEPLSDDGNLEGSGIFRVGRPMHRQPFMAVYENPAPRKEMRPCSLAVAPIKQVDPGDGSNDYWAEGLTEDLILELSRTRRIEVSSRTTLFAIKSHDAVDIGRELGVSYVLSGSFRKMGQSARLNFTLAETGKGSVVWSERFTVEFDKIFDVLDEIVAKVVARIAGKIEHSEMEAARVRRPENMTAYEYYLRGLWHHRMGGVTTEHSRKAVEWLRKAIRADPSFHRPRAMLACAWSDLPEFDPDRAARSVTIAYEADPTDPDASRIMAWVKFTKGEFDLGLRHAELSVELAPHDAYLLGRCAAIHIFNGDPETGLAHLRRAVELDPFMPVHIVEERLVAHYAMHDYEKVLSEARALHHQTRRSRYYAAAALVALDRLDAAQKVIQTALDDDPSLSLDYVRGQEPYRDKRLLRTLFERLSMAGVPA